MPKSVPKEKSLAHVNPELAKQWHPTKNGDLTPLNVTARNGKKVWWKCLKGDDHEWKSNIYNRNKGNGCPVCAGQKIVLSNCLFSTHNKIAKQWHPTKNLPLTPFEVSHGSCKKVWWKCLKGDDHEWIESVSNRARGRGCPVCSGRKTVFSNSIASTHPKMTKFWHPTKNLPLTPFEVSHGSHKKVWWKCPKGKDHEWFATIASNRKFEYFTSENLIGCPICSGKKIVMSNCLATTNPNLSLEWHPKKNLTLTPYNVGGGSHKKVWWKCSKGDDHEWKSNIYNRVKGSGCPVCSGRKTVKSKSLAVLNPNLALQWHPTKNKSLTPFDVSEMSNKKVWWKCPKGDDHEWTSDIANRSLGNNCPVCAGQKIVLSNCLLTTHNKLAEQWNHTKNGSLTPYKVSSGSDKKVWWQCSNNKSHEWRAAISSRVYGRGCPFCTLTPQSRQELIITHELLTIFKGINPKGFKLSIGGKLRSIDIYIPELNLGIEFDGAYWHKDKREFDKLKTREFESIGVNIIRVRQKPLKRIFDSDVMAEKKYDGKAITNDILRQILKDYNLNKRIINKIHAYLDKTKLQNENGLNKYIDMILDEKAERKIIKTPE